jgi:hypothetical protein
MRIAWFRETPTDASSPLDATAPLINALRSSHDISVIEQASAYDFVWQQLRRPSDLCVFEIDNTRAHEFIWGYLANYPGVVLLHSTDIVHLRAIVLSARLTVVNDRGLADRVQHRFPAANVRYAPALATAEDDLATDPVSLRPDETDAARARVTTFAVHDRRPRGGRLVDRAIDRARNAGATFDIVDRNMTAGALASADVLIAPMWPPFSSSSTPVLAAMAAGKAVITTETEATAQWPAIDPQTWRSRGLLVEEPPIAVTVDPRDEEHSLMLAVRRLASDAAMRQQLGRAARTWWAAHATPRHATAAWAAILEEAATLPALPQGEHWPKPFVLDGTELARELLREFGLSSEIYEGPSERSHS